MNIINTNLEEMVLEPWQMRIQETRKKKNQLSKRQKEERLDEQYAAGRVLEWCKRNSITLLPIQRTEVSGKRPDYVFHHNNEPVMLEVRQLGTGSVEYEGEVIDRSHDGHKLFFLYERLADLIFLWADKTQTIILIALCPIEKLNKKVENINELLRKTFQGKRDAESVDFEEALVVASSTTFYKNSDQYSPLKIIPVLSLVHSDHIVQNNYLIGLAKLVLLQAILDKESKYHVVTMRKWLALINTSPLLTIKEYQKAYDLLRLEGKVPHSFEKIFVIVRWEAHLLI